MSMYEQIHVVQNGLSYSQHGSQLLNSSINHKDSTYRRIAWKLLFYVRDVRCLSAVLFSVSRLEQELSLMQRPPIGMRFFYWLFIV